MLSPMESFQGQNGREFECQGVETLPSVSLAADRQNHLDREMLGDVLRDMLETRVDTS